MAKIIELIAKGSEFPLEYVMALIALAAIGLSAFAIQVIYSVARRRDD